MRFHWGGRRGDSLHHVRPSDAYALSLVSCRAEGVPHVCSLGEGGRGGGERRGGARFCFPPADAVRARKKVGHSANQSCWRKIQASTAPHVRTVQSDGFSSPPSLNVFARAFLVFGKKGFFLVALPHKSPRCSFSHRQGNGLCGASGHRRRRTCMTRHRKPTPISPPPTKHPARVAIRRYKGMRAHNKRGFYFIFIFCVSIATLLLKGVSPPLFST